MIDIFRKNKLYHREDGPAYTRYDEDGTIDFEKYFIKGKLHREDGPAHIKYDQDGSMTYQAYYTNGWEGLDAKLLYRQKEVK
jgi:antitoxin component YwqK of YwqJK toxin-antitoxin module